MPTYESVIDGKPRRIEITKTGENVFTAKIDDKSVEIELPNPKPDLDRPFSVRIGEKTYSVELPKVEQGKTVQIKIEEATFKAEVRAPARKQMLTAFEPTAPATPTRRASSSRQTVAEGAVTAPMTGKIVSVKVKKDDQVKADQVLCIIEAMKMENEITASKAGTVQEVNVSEGSPVSEGDVLFVIG